MKERALRIFALLFGILCVVGLSMALARASQADQALAPGLPVSPPEPGGPGREGVANILHRDLEPVIVAGALVPGFAGVPADELFLYAYANDTWTQIPSQVDEVTAFGAYTYTVADDPFDAEDEIVFMAKDTGNIAPEDQPITATLPVSDTWYRIAVSDPVEPSGRGWAYLVRSKVLARGGERPSAMDYVDYDDVLQRINGATYHLGLATSSYGFDYLALGAGGVDILDRTKVRLYGAQQPKTEDNLGALPPGFIRDGPVRVILWDGQGFAYRSMVQWQFHMSPFVFPLHRQALRFSTDFAETAAGSIHYSAAVTDGVTVDGVPDAVPETPFSPWWQLTTGEGTIIQAGDASGLGAGATTYYLDDLALDPADTGDGRSYGDAGVAMITPSLALTYKFALYSLPGIQENVGALYQTYFDNPLKILVFREDTEVALEVEPQSLTVCETAALTATVVDRLGEPLAGIPVTFTVALGQGTIDPEVAITGADGKAFSSFTTERAGTHAVKATAKAEDSENKRITVAPGPVFAVALEAVPTELYVGQTSSLIATLLDQYSNLIGGTPATFTVVSGQGTVTPPVVMSDEDGRAIASLASDVPGTVVVKATAGSVNSAERPVTFKLVEYLWLEAMPTRVLLGGSSALTATVFDRFGAPVSGAEVTFTIVSGAGTVAPAVVYTGDDGRATSYLTTSVPGVVAAEAMVEAKTSEPVSVTFFESYRHYLPLVLRDGP